MRRLTLIRHGLTEGNVRRWYYGALDLPLCETGKSALREAASVKENKKYIVEIV